MQSIEHTTLPLVDHQLLSFQTDELPYRYLIQKGN